MDAFIIMLACHKGGYEQWYGEVEWHACTHICHIPACKPVIDWSGILDVLRQAVEEWFELAYSHQSSPGGHSDWDKE